MWPNTGKNVPLIEGAQPVLEISLRAEGLLAVPHVIENTSGLASLRYRSSYRKVLFVLIRANSWLNSLVFLRGSFSASSAVLIRVHSRSFAAKTPAR
jgi:hypothetical protein